MTRPTEWFYRWLGVSLGACVIDDLFGGVWQVHQGRLFAWRHVPALPLFPAPWMVGIWLLLGCAGVSVACGVQRALGTRLACIGLILSLSQAFSNHRSLLLLVFACLAFPLGGEIRHRLSLVRYQLLLVYGFSALNKITSGFCDGLSLVHLGAAIPAGLVPAAVTQAVFSPSVSVPLSIAVVGAELLAPVLLMTAPRVGLMLVVVLHGGFALIMPGIWPFTFAMIAMACLFLPDPVSGATLG